MTIKLFLLVITCVTIGALAQLAMKIGMSGPAVQATLGSGIGANFVWAVVRNPLVIGGLFAYFVGAGLWLLVLSKADLSLVFPFTGLGFILTMLFGWLFLNEDVGTYRVVGTLLIASGAYLIAKS
jgi:uncharacterized membrane protein